MRSTSTQFLRLQVRRDLEFHRSRLRGRDGWLVKDPLQLEYVHISDEECYLMRLLDGQSSPRAIAAAFETAFAPQTLSPGRLQEFVAAFFRQGLLVADAAGQGEELWERRAGRRRRQSAARWLNLLAIRLRGVDPERFLTWLSPVGRVLFSTLFFALVCGLVLTALLITATRFDQLIAGLPAFHEFFSAGNLVWLLVALGVVKVLHELGHGLACKRFGGECHEIGILFLAGMPCLYCDTSDAWKTPGKWNRIAISGAGIYVELLLSALCTFVWWATEPGLLHWLSLNVMFVCSVNSVFFNGNPLLRYDGYYILSDLVEIPNLAAQARSACRGVVSRLLTGGTREPSSQVRDRPWLLVGFGLASFLYRLFVIGAILWFFFLLLSSHELEILFVPIAAAAFVAVAAEPAMSFSAWLRRGEHRRVGRVRLAICLVTAAVVGTALLFMPWPHAIEGPAVIQPRDATAVYVTVPGRVVHAVAAGEEVEQDSTVAELENLQLAAEVDQLEAERDAAFLRLEQLRALEAENIEAAGIVPTAKERLVRLEEQLVLRREELNRLTLIAPASGMMIPPPPLTSPPDSDQLDTWSGSPLDEENRSAWLRAGTLLGHVGDPRRVEAVVFLDETDMDHVRVGQAVEVRLPHRGSETLLGRVVEIATGETAVRDRANDVQALQEQRTYRVRVELNTDSGPLLLREQGRARIKAGTMSAVRRVWRFFVRTLRVGT